MTILAMLFANKWVRYAAAALGILLIIWGVYGYVTHKARVEGIAQGHAEAATEAETARQQDKRDMEARFSTLASEISAARQESERWRQVAAQKDAVILSLAAQRNSVATQVAGMTEEQVKSLIEKHSPREIAECVTQYPLCQQQVIAQNEKIDALSNEMAEDKRGNLATAEQLQIAVENYNSLTRIYTAIYNAQAPKVRSWKCAGLWRCVKKTIPFPDPITLRNPIKN
jgi:hypothetical protein